MRHQREQVATKIFRHVCCSGCNSPQQHRDQHRSDHRGIRLDRNQGGRDRNHERSLEHLTTRPSQFKPVMDPYRPHGLHHLYTFDFLSKICFNYGSNSRKSGFFKSFIKTINHVRRIFV